MDENNYTKPKKLMLIAQVDITLDKFVCKNIIKFGNKVVRSWLLNPTTMDEKTKPSKMLKKKRKRNTINDQE